MPASPEPVSAQLHGLIAGALNGSLRQTIALMVVTGGGNMNEPGFVEAAAVEAITGAAAIAMAGAGPAADYCKILNRRQQTITRADHRDLSADIRAMFHFSFRPC